MIIITICNIDEYKTMCETMIGYFRGEAMTLRRKGVSLTTVRRVNANLVQGVVSTLEKNETIPTIIKQTIRDRNYSTEEINAGYARVLARRTVE